MFMYENGLIRKIRLVSKSMMSQPGSQTIAIHIFTNISRSKSNQRFAFTSYKAFSKTKKRSGTSLSDSFSA